MTPAQKKILEYIERYVEENGASPSYREIQEAFQYRSIASVQEHLQNLTNQGHLKKRRSKKRISRSIAIHKKSLGFEIPVLGEIAAGSVTESIEQTDKFITVDQAYERKHTYALTVHGTSMIDIGIYEGDTIIVDAHGKIKENDIVVALIDGKNTVKRIRWSDTEVILIPENRNMKPIKAPKSSVVIQGKVIGLQRKY